MKSYERFNMLRNKITFTNKKRLKNPLILIVLFVLVCLFAIMILFLDAEFGFTTLNLVFWKQILAIVCGASCLGIGTYLLQEMTNNKLADTSILGIGNINLIVSIFLVISFNVSNYEQSKNFLTTNSWIFTIFSFLTVLCLYLLSFSNKKFSSSKMMFIGIVLKFLLIGLYYGLITFVPSNKKDYIQEYLNGTISTPSDVQFLIGYILLFISICWIFIIKKKIFILYTDYVIAKTIGIKPNNLNFQVIFIIGILSGVAFFMLGNIFLLGLLGASCSYLIFKRNYNYSIFGSALICILFMFIAFFLNNNILSIFFPKLSNLAIYWFPIIGVIYFVCLLIKRYK
ncbi:iron chelate uptake ABC transporter family permease subunit [Malacoplasma iowae]|uniref:iron chelate uptake ABC transporter family permease subunit n=1 Tax=Malacoplasma iowae TaxID=2116 RepID=UPI002A18E8E8|nr:iron chelate uptake ABC transporter family permease subunit [Malacoplasma iowae]WPL37698.1 iron chelate uptake ABC transporter family permease subunit [Malacoplasma iowae]